MMYLYLGRNIFEEKSFGALPIGMSQTSAILLPTRYQRGAWKLVNASDKMSPSTPDVSTPLT